MAKRIKKVFSNADEVIHIWANQSQSDARCKNAYFEGRSVWSYGSHYELGRLVEINGVTVALINDTGYSKTTAGHISSAWSATSHLPRIKVYEFTKAGFEAGLLRTQDTLLNNLFRVFNQTKFHSSYKVERTDWELTQIETFNRTCQAIGRAELIIEVPNDYIELANAHIQLRQQRQAELQSPEALAKAERNRERAQERNRERLADQIEAWRSGGALTVGLKALEPRLLRVRGNEVQTTGGASVPLEHAIRLLRLVRAGRARNGERIGHYTVSGVDGGVIRIGCHVIAVAEAEQVLAGVNPRLELVETGGAV